MYIHLQDTAYMLNTYHLSNCLQVEHSLYAQYCPVCKLNTFHAKYCTVSLMNIVYMNTNHLQCILYAEYCSFAEHRLHPI